MISNFAREAAANASPLVSMMRTQYGSLIEKAAGSNQKALVQRSICEGRDISATGSVKNA
jgi:hypothetical protein